MVSRMVSFVWENTFSYQYTSCLVFKRVSKGDENVVSVLSLTMNCPGTYSCGNLSLFESWLCSVPSVGIAQAMISTVQQIQTPMIG